MVTATGIYALHQPLTLVLLDLERKYRLALPETGKRARIGCKCK